MKIKISESNRKKSLRNFFIIIFIGIFIFYLLNHFIFQRSRIFYIINYEVDLSNSDLIIEKTENLDYHSYLNYEFESSERRIINRTFINNLMQDIDQAAIEFHWWPFYTYNFIYTFKATFESRLYLKYNNNTIYWANYGNNVTIFPSANHYDENLGISWYINFSQVPTVPGTYFEISLNNTYLVIMSLEYNYLCGSLCGLWYEIEQYIILDSNLQIICIYIPFSPAAVA